MIKRGRKSAAELAVVTPISDHRQVPPANMPEVQRQIWQIVIGRLPYDWFKAEHLELLRAYCQHVAIAQTIARQIEGFRPEWLAEDGGLDRFDQLSRLLDREHRMVLALARSMRFTHQSQYDKTLAAKAARDAPMGRAPWEHIR
jgi:hypothetical protein